MSRRLRLAGLGAGAAFLLLALLAGIERGRGTLALKSRLNALAAQGERLSLDKLIPKPAPPGENAFAELTGVTKELEALVGKVSEGPRLEFSGPGQAVEISAMEEWGAKEGAGGNWKRFAEQFKGAEALLPKLRAAADKVAYDSGFDYRSGFVDFKMGQALEAKRSCQALSWSAMQNLRQGDMATAHQDLVALARLTALQGTERLTMAQLIRQSGAVLAFNTTWLALQTRGLSKPQLETLQEAWQKCDFVGDMELALEMERALTMDLFAQFRSSPAKLATHLARAEQADAAVAGALGSLPTHGFALKRMNLPLWKAVWAEQDQLSSLNRWQGLIERERTARTGGWAAMTGGGQGGRESAAPWFEGTEERSRYDRMRFLVSGANPPPAEQLIRRTLSTQTMQQMTVAALAIERYRLHCGKFPKHLGELHHHHHLASAPRDWMDGKPLRYKHEQRGFRLYSVGHDGKDDGGDPSPEGTHARFRDIWDGRDAVWPTTAP